MAATFTPSAHAARYCRRVTKQKNTGSRKLRLTPNKEGKARGNALPSPLAFWTVMLTPLGHKAVAQTILDKMVDYIIRLFAPTGIQLLEFVKNQAVFVAQRS